MNRASMLALALAALLAGFLTQRWLKPPPVSPPLAEPVLVDLQGGRHALAEWRGKVVVLNFWATWCPPCREEMPVFAALQQEYGERGLQFVGVAIDDPAEVRAFLAKHPVNYPILVGGSDVPGWADSLGNSLSALPFSVILDRSGQVVYRHVGVFRRDQALNELKALLDPG
jgi:thiol-disulfide isomerase/thioredoxin